MKTSKRALFKTLFGEFFISGGCADTLMKTRKVHKRHSYRILTAWLPSSPEELITRDHGRPMWTLVQEKTISITNTVRIMVSEDLTYNLM